MSLALLNISGSKILHTWGSAYLLTWRRSSKRRSSPTSGWNPSKSRKTDRDWRNACNTGIVGLPLASVVETSRRVAATSKRLEKTELLARLLKEARGDEIPVLVSFLSGDTRQGRTGIGYATVRASDVSPAATPTLDLLAVDSALTALAEVKGSGSERRRREQLQALLALATSDEQ